MSRPFRLWRLLALSILLVPSARAEQSWLTVSLPEAGHLVQEVQSRVPGFGGYTLGWTAPRGLHLTPLLVFPGLAAQGRAAVQQLTGQPTSGAVPARYSLRTLLAAARKVQALTPTPEVQLDLALNRVLVPGTRADAQTLAARAGLTPDLLIGVNEEPQVQHVLIPAGPVRAARPFPPLIHRVRNPMNRPVWLPEGCQLAVLPALQPAAGDSGCTDAFVPMVLQPGEHRDFLLKLRERVAPSAGTYHVWLLDGLNLPLTVQP